MATGDQGLTANVVSVTGTVSTMRAADIELVHLVIIDDLPPP